MGMREALDPGFGHRADRQIALADFVGRCGIGAVHDWRATVDDLGDDALVLAPDGLRPSTVTKIAAGKLGVAPTLVLAAGAALDDQADRRLGRASQLMMLTYTSWMSPKAAVLV